jgi:hypothetical protein
LELNPLFFEGTTIGRRTGEWVKTPGAPPTKYGALQILEKSERPGDESVKFIEINLPDGDDGSAYKVGQTVRLRVKVTAKDKKIYYRVEEDANGAAPAGTPLRAGAKA